jgi:hypothetical protein
MNNATLQTSASLMPFTKLVLAVSGIVQLLFAVVGLFLPELWNSVFWTTPLPSWAPENIRFAALNYVGAGIAALFALRQGTWATASTYFAFAAPYIILSVILALISSINPGVPPIMWLYVLLSIIYLPCVVYVWISQTRRNSSQP